METIYLLFGQGKDLSMLQMSLRGVVTFLFALLLMRVAGHRTFGHKSASDNVVMIMLGAVLSRAIVGASPFMPVLGSSLSMVLLHRLLTWLCLRHETIGAWIKGERICLYKDGKLISGNLNKSLLSHKDVMEGVRNSLNEDSLEQVKEIFLERSGDISVIKK